MRKRIYVLTTIAFLSGMSCMVSAASLPEAPADGAQSTEAVEPSTEAGTETPSIPEIPPLYPVDTYAVSLNNLEDEIDHKHSDAVLKELWTFSRIVTSPFNDDTLNRVIEGGDRKYTDYDISSRYSDDYVQARGYLIEQGILERPTKIGIDNSGGVHAERYQSADKEGEDYDWLGYNVNASRSDVYVMLHKALYGVEESRVIDYAYTAPDAVVHELYTTGSVYELYLQSLLEKGLLNKSELKSDSDLTGTGWDSKGYDWSNSRGAVGHFPSVNGLNAINYEWVNCSGVLGKSFVIEQNDTGFIITPRMPDYFVNEEMTLIDLLTIVETFLKNTEKEITDTEARIVAYKYGVEYLSELTEEEYNTVAFLIAKGVMSFEDYKSLGFFETVRWKDVIPVIYRTVNQEARYNFSVIQLTDGEAFWQEQGFSAESFTLTVPKEGTEYTLETQSVEENENVIGKLTDLVRVQAASKAKKYKVVKDFDLVNLYKYKGVDIKTLTAQTDTGTVSSGDYPEITKVEDIDSLGVRRITFTVTARSSTRAVQMVDDNITAVIKDAASYKISGVMKINDGKEIRLVSKSVLQYCFGSSIDFVEDKVLQNTNTGVMACFLEESNYALVGNQIFADEKIVVTATDDEVYYNFDVVASLLGMPIVNFYSKSVNTQKICSGAKSYSAPVYNASGAQFASAEYLVANSGIGDGASFDLNESSMTNPTYLYNVNHVANGINTVYRVFYDKFSDVSTAKKEPFVVVVDWVYAVPDLDAANEANLLPDTVTSSSATWKEVFEALYEAPAEGTALRRWWDTNMCMSQGLTNLLFGQKNVEYVKCGYMVPSVTVLLPPSAGSKYTGKNSWKNVSKLLINHGFSVPSSYGNCLDGSTSNFLTKYYSRYTGLTGDSKEYQDLRALAGSSRRCEVLKGTKYKKSSSCYYGGGDFFLEGTSILYRDINNDKSRFEYAEDGNTNTLTKIVVRDRVAASSAVPMSGATVHYRGGGVDQTFIYLGVETKSMSNGLQQYVKLVPIVNEDKLPKFVVTKDGSEYKASYKTGQMYSSWEEWVIEKFYKQFGIDRGVVDEDSWLSSIFSSGSGSEVFKLYDRVVSEYRELNGPFGLYYGDKGVLGVYQAGNDAWKSVKLTKSKVVYGIPTIYLPAGDYYVYQPGESDEWTIGKGRASYLLNQSNLYYSGIVSGVIEAVLAKSVKTTEVGALDDETILFVNDMKFVKAGDYWYSYPVRNATAASSAKSGNAWNSISSLCAAFMVTCDGVNLPFMNYVEECNLSDKYTNKIPTKAVCATVDNGGNVQLVKKISNKKMKVVKNSATPQYVVYKVKFSRTLLVRPLTSDHSVYRMCSTVSEKVVNGTRVPFFNEDLSYSEDTRTSFSLSQGGYENTSALEIEKEDFDVEYQERWYEDFSTLVIFAAAVIASYLTVISWAVYLGVTRGTCLWLLESLAGRARIDGKIRGLDLVRLASFGIYNLDSPPAFTRCVVVTFVCLLVVTACVLLY